MGSCGGTVGRAVTSNARAPRFESHQPQFSDNCNSEKKNQNEKEAGRVHLNSISELDLLEAV